MLRKVSKTKSILKHSRPTHVCIIEIDHNLLDVELPPLTPLLPAGFTAELIPAAGTPTQVYWTESWKCKNCY
jgi:hypothetical protein